MPFLNFFNMFQSHLAKMTIVTSVPMTILLVGLEAIMNVHFSCPCKAELNVIIVVLIFFAPALFASLVMLLLLWPCTNNCSYFQEQNNGGSERQNIGGASQGQDIGGTSQSRKNNSVEALSCGIAFGLCIFPCLVWTCALLINGDYVACAYTQCYGRYACDKELNPNCLNWCKPMNSSQNNETRCYEITQELTTKSKIAGYGVVIVICTIGILVVSIHWCKNGIACCKDGIPLTCRFTDPESQSHEQQGSRTEEQQGPYTEEQQGSRTEEQQGSRTEEQQGSRTEEQQGSRTEEQQGSRTEEQQGSRTEEQQGPYTEEQPKQPIQLRSFQGNRFENTTEDATVTTNF